MICGLAIFVKGPGKNSGTGCPGLGFDGHINAGVGLMMRWVRRMLAAHLFASYCAWAALLIVALMTPGARKHLGIILIEGVAAPIIMPLFLAISFDGVSSVHLEPSAMRFVLWRAYLVAFGLIMAGWRKIEAKRELARERRRMGICVRCGYDLRGSPGRCPECGVVPGKG